MTIKIYFGDKPLFLCDAIDAEVEPFIHHDDAVYIDELDTHTIKTIIHEMQQPQVHAGVFLNKDLEELKQALFKKFTFIQAAGGLVVNDNGEVLLMFRRGKWDLPKGKLDEGEQLDACALREVEEETGLKNVELMAPLLVTYHTYHEGSKFIMKESHWYTMRVKEEQTLVPQTEEDILELNWVSPDRLSPYLKNAFPSVVDVLKAGFPE